MYGAATVEDLDGLVVVVAWDDHLGAEGEAAICGDEDVAGLDLVAGCGYAVGVWAATLLTGTVGGDTHCEGLPVVGLGGIGCG